MEAAPAPAADGAPWRLRHPVLARVALYGLGAAAGAVLLVLLSRRRGEDESERQAGLWTRLHGVETFARLDPERALREVRTEVLAKDPDDEVRREAFLMEAFALDLLERYEEAARGYAALDRSWPAARPRGPLVVPWANMLVTAGKPEDARRLFERPGATDGFPPEDVRKVRERIDAALSKSSPGAPPPSPSGPGR